MSGYEILRASILHTPVNPFKTDDALRSFEDGGLLVRYGRIVTCGDYHAVAAGCPTAVTRDWRGGFILPGFVDTHLHFPQLRIIGGLGRTLLDWLDQVALPEEARMADDAYAVEIARGFVHALSAHGTTTALVYGAHFASATRALFEASRTAGLRIVSGLVLSDRLLRPELHQAPQAAYDDSAALIRGFHQQGRLLYAVTPRFALSASEAMLEVCQSLLRDHPGVRFTTHLNENEQEIAEVARLFPWARDYLSAYERYDLGGPGTVIAHSVWTTNEELARLAARGTSVAHCPCSNAALGSGMFPLRRHLDAGVHVALGTDVGGGTGFGMPKEALQAYFTQRTVNEGVSLSAAHLLYLATLAGAEALALDGEVGDFVAGKAADLVLIRPADGSELAQVLQRAESLEQSLAAIFTLAGHESVREVRVEGQTVYRSGGA
jgi:guanine deaminase